MCVDVEEYELEALKSLENLPYNVVVSFFVSTYGEGEFPHGALPFEKFLSEMGEGKLASLRFTLLGLGNSTYEFYNEASRKVLECLKKTKATLIGEHGLADAGAGTTDEDYLTWKEATMTELKKQLHLEEQEEKFESAFEPKRIATVSDKVSFDEPSSQYLPFNSLFGNLKNVQLGLFDSNHPYLAAVLRSRELFKSKDRSCIHSEFDISGSSIE